MFLMIRYIHTCMYVYMYVCICLLYPHNLFTDPSLFAVFKKMKSKFGATTSRGAVSLEAFCNFTMQHRSIVAPIELIQVHFRSQIINDAFWDKVSQERCDDPEKGDLFYIAKLQQTVQEKREAYKAHKAFLKAQRKQLEHLGLGKEGDRRDYKQRKQSVLLGYYSMKRAVSFMSSKRVHADAYTSEEQDIKLEKDKRERQAGDLGKDAKGASGTGSDLVIIDAPSPYEQAKLNAAAVEAAEAEAIKSAELITMDEVVHAALGDEAMMNELHAQQRKQGKSSKKPHRLPPLDTTSSSSAKSPKKPNTSSRSPKSSNNGKGTAGDTSHNPKMVSPPPPAVAVAPTAVAGPPRIRRRRSIVKPKFTTAPDAQGASTHAKAKLAQRSDPFANARKDKMHQAAPGGAGGGGNDKHQHGSGTGSAAESKQRNRGGGGHHSHHHHHSPESDKNKSHKIAPVSEKQKAREARQQAMEKHGKKKDADAEKLKKS